MIVYPSSAIYSGQTVVVSYDQSAAGTDAIADPAGNDVADFTTGDDGVPAVTNYSTAMPPSTDATLSGLTVTGGGSDLVTFASGTTTYTAMVASAVDEVTVTPTKNDTEATIEWLDASDATIDDANTSTTGQQVTLTDGDNVIKVKVTAADKSTSLTYTVTVNRPAAATTPTCTLNTGDLWCGVVTVGTVIDQHGVTTGHGFEGTTGDLSDKMFTVGTNPYTINAIITGSGNAAGYLSLALTDTLSNADENDLVLHVDNDSFAFSAASRNSAAYNWASSGLDWSSESSVTLHLRGAAAANAAPAFTFSATFNPAENQTTVGTVEASDDDMDDEITGYALTGGADQALFSIGSTSGALTFQAAPNYEDPQDADTDNAYEVTVQATSGTGGRVQTNTQPITVTVTNADEGQTGTVSIDDTSPMVDDELTASTTGVADPDGLPDPFAPTWQWYRTPAGGSETELPGATSATYTVVEADFGAALTAKASWTDVGAFANTLTSAPTDAVTAKVSAALPELSVAGASATEGSVVTFTVTLSEASTQAVTATWTASIESGDTAESADFTDLSMATGMVTVAVSDTTATFTVATVDDSTDEDNDTFTLTLSTPTNATLAADPTATGTINDNDDAPTISVQDQTVNEGNQDPESLVEDNFTNALFPFRVTLSEVSEKRVRYKVRRVELASDTATDADLDSNPTLYHGAQAIAAGHTVRILGFGAIRDDALDEPDETFTVELYDFENATAGTQTRVTITIADDDDPPTVSVADAEATEGDGVEFAVTLSEASGWEVTVNWATTGDTATSDTDFTAASDTLTFMPGEMEKTITVETTEDTTDEDDETFTLTLSSPSNVTLAADPTATGTIKDNDDPPMLSVAGGSAAEGSAVTFTVTLSAVATADVTATWTASLETGDTATAADFTDLSAATGMVTVTKGQTTATFTVATAQDTTDEENETFTVTLSTPSSNATLAADPTATGTINDDDAEPTLSIADSSASEGSAMTFTVTLTPASGKTVGVGWGLDTNGTASDADFSGATLGTVTFPPGDTKATFTVTVVADGVTEGDETFEVNLGSATNASISENSATGTISDSDMAATAPTIDSVAVTSTPVLETDTYGTGETIRFTVTFDEAVDVAGDPTFRFALGNSGSARDVDAAYASGSGMTALVFSYTVVSSDVDGNGIFLYDGTELDNPDGPVRLDTDDSIVAVAGGGDADLAWPSGRGTQSGHKVDGSQTPDATTCTLNTGDIWCGVVTVEELASGDGFFGTIGGLSDTEFDYETTMYTITSLHVSDSMQLGFSLNAALTTAAKAKLVLHVGTTSFAFSDASYSPGP